mmetsp:Transcript_2205/g.2847  ORF Transcript_2205/g.2847 Transcript_2205/m.2847 type:complete len:328 (+) Transcript_2205:672-1655(+)
MQFKPIFHDMSEKYGSDKVKFVTVSTKVAPEVANNLMVASVPAFFFYRNNECISQFAGANKAKLEGLVKMLKTSVDDTEKAKLATAAAPAETMVIRLKRDLGFIQFKPISSQVILFENIANMNKIGAKIKEVIAGIDDEGLSELKDLMSNFQMSGLNEDILSQLLICTDKCGENDIFALFDFLRCCFIKEKLVVSATGDNWELLDKSISRLESLSEGDPSTHSKHVVNAQMTSTQALCNLFKFRKSGAAFIESPEKANRFLSFAGKMLSSQKDKTISAAASIALNVMIKFDEVKTEKIEADKSIKFEDQMQALNEGFETIEEGSRVY